MTGADAARAYSLLYSPNATELAHPLPAIGERLSAQLVELHTRPTPDGAERLAFELEGVRRHLLKLREALQREVVGQVGHERAG